MFLLTPWDWNNTIIDDELMKQWKFISSFLWCEAQYDDVWFILSVWIWTNRHDHGSLTDFSYCWIFIRRYHTGAYRFIPLISFPVSLFFIPSWLWLSSVDTSFLQWLWLLLVLLLLLLFFFRLSVQEELMSFFSLTQSKFCPEENWPPTEPSLFFFLQFGHRWSLVPCHCHLCLA